VAEEGAAAHIRHFIARGPRHKRLAADPFWRFHPRPGCGRSDAPQRLGRD